jgi:hypothetical protein
MNNMFQELELPISKFILSLPKEYQQEVYNYLFQLDEHNRQAYLIAYNHLGTSFNILKSNGYKEWINKKN